MKTYYKIGLVLFFAIGISGCKKYLDVTPDNTATLDYAFRNRLEAQNYLFTCYSVLQKLSDVTSNAGFTGSAEIVIPDPSLVTQSNLGAKEVGFNILKGGQNVVQPAQDFWDGNNTGFSMFQAIRRCNIFLENIDKPIDLPDYERDQWIGEVKFLKAYYHYWLLRMYGPIPILRKSLPIDVGINEAREKRMPVDSVFNYIDQLLDESIISLPMALTDANAEFGRATKVIARAVKAEVLTTAASPLFNGNADLAAFKGKDGTALFSQTSDQKKWEKAMDACKVAVETAEASGAKLYEFIKPGNMGAISAQLNLVLTLQNAITEKSDLNPEVIWALNPYFGYQKFALPRLTSFGASQYHEIKSNFSVPLTTVQLFYTNHGIPVYEDKTWDYSGRFTVQNGNDANSAYIKKDYPTAKLNFDREARYYASLGFDGGIWFGHGKTKENEALYVRTTGTKEEAYAGPNNYMNINVTGYWPKKLVNYQTTYFLNNQNDVSEIPFRLPMIRLSDLYLLYAETINEVKGPADEAFRYIDLVRKRAGLNDLRSSWDQYAINSSKYTTKEGLRQIIHQERRIELCFEGRVGWDIRRWKELELVLGDAIQGFNWRQVENRNAYNTPQTLFRPVFNKRDYLWPISDNSLIVNPNLVQNPGW